MSIIGIVCILFAYLLGAVPFGLVLTRGSGIDIRREGSRNIGATNVARLLGKKMGALTLVLDILKGFAPMFLAALVVGSEPQRDLIVALCGAASVIGHMFPVYLGFKGGKGVATALALFSSWRRWPCSVAWRSSFSPCACPATSPWAHCSARPPSLAGSSCSACRPGNGCWPPSSWL